MGLRPVWISAAILLAAGFACPPGEAAQPSAATWFSQTPFRSDAFDIALKADGTEGSELEYKVGMKAGETLVYSWAVEGIANPQEFYYDFHGETVPNPKGAESSYRKRTGAVFESGGLTAPFTGIHGWYFQNQSEKPVVVHLKIAGFYRLIPKGADGNEAGIEPLRNPK